MPPVTLKARSSIWLKMATVFDADDDMEPSGWSPRQRELIWLDNSAPEAILSYLRKDGGETILTVINLSDSDVRSKKEKDSHINSRPVGNHRVPHIAWDILSLRGIP